MNGHLGLEGDEGGRGQAYPEDAGAADPAGAGFWLGLGLAYQQCVSIASHSARIIPVPDSLFVFYGRILEHQVPYADRTGLGHLPSAGLDLAPCPVKTDMLRSLLFLPLPRGGLFLGLLCGQRGTVRQGHTGVSGPSLLPTGQHWYGHACQCDSVWSLVIWEVAES